MVTRGASGLYQRVNRANKMKADIFLSIHHDGVRDEYLRPWTYNGKRRFFFDGSEGFSLHISSNNVRYRESIRLAQLLADQLIAKGLHFTKVHEPTNPVGARVPFLDPMRGIYRRDNLIVLSKTDMPAVLVEAGVIVNRTEESVVSAPAYQGIIAAAIVGAVRAFCNPRESAATYKVVNVGPDDALSVRSGPNAALSILGAIPAKADRFPYAHPSHKWL
jgi:N-acetylmuramoyl-L-alanine amidase